MNTKKIVYFNNAATTWPKPKSVITSVQETLKFPIEEQGRTSLKGRIDIVGSAREVLSQFFNTSSTDSFVFTQNATDSLNILIHGFLKKKSEKIHVITSELEHNSVLRPLKTLEKNGSISLSIAPFEENKINLEALKKLITSETRLLVLTHGSNVLGSVQNIKKICEYFNSNEIFTIIDGAQTAGQIDVDFSKIPVDAFVFTGHKSLFGIPGIGGFFLRDSESIDAVKQGGTGIYSHLLYQPEEMPTKFEVGTPNYIGIASLYAGIEYINNIGLDEIERKTMRMTNYILSNLGKNENITIYNSNPELPIISFNINSIDNSEVGYILSNNYNIIIRTGLHCAPLVHKKIDGCMEV